MKETLIKMLKKIRYVLLAFVVVVVTILALNNPDEDVARREMWKPIYKQRNYLVFSVWKTAWKQGAPQETWVGFYGEFYLWDNGYQYVGK